MRQRLAPLLPFALITLLTACAMQPEQTESPLLTQRFQFDFPIETSEADADPEAVTAEPTDQQLPEFADDESYELRA